MEIKEQNERKGINDKREKIQKEFSDFSKPYREIAMEKALEIMSDDKKKDEQKKFEIDQLVKVVKAISAYISDITRNVKEMIYETDDVQRYLQVFETLGRPEDVEKFKLNIQEIRQFVAKLNVTIDEIVSNLDLQKAKQLLRQIDIKKAENELILSRVQENGKVKRALKKESVPKKKKRCKLSEKTKKIMKSLGVTSLAALMGVYIATGVTNKISSVDLEDDYENGATVESIIESGELKEIFLIVSEKKYGSHEELQEQYAKFKEEFIKLSDSTEIYTTYSDKKHLSSEEREELNRSKTYILNYKNFSKKMQALIKAKLANAVSKSNTDFDEHKYESNIEIGAKVTYEDGFNDNYKYIKYKIKENEERTITNTDQFTIGLFSKDKNGRMSAEFVDIVDIYLELKSNKYMDEEKRVEIFQAVAAFLDKEIEIEQSKPCKGKLQISDKKDDDGR